MKASHCNCLLTASCVRDTELIKLTEKENTEQASPPHHQLLLDLLAPILSPAVPAASTLHQTFRSFSRATVFSCYVTAKLVNKFKHRCRSCGFDKIENERKKMSFDVCILHTTAYFYLSLLLRSKFRGKTLDI